MNEKWKLKKTNYLFYFVNKKIDLLALVFLSLSLSFSLLFFMLKSTRIHVYIFLVKFHCRKLFERRFFFIVFGIEVTFLSAILKVAILKKAVILKCVSHLESMRLLQMWCYERISKRKRGREKYTHTLHYTYINRKISSFISD